MRYSDREDFFRRAHNVTLLQYPHNRRLHKARSAVHWQTKRPPTEERFAVSAGKGLMDNDGPHLAIHLSQRILLKQGCSADHTSVQITDDSYTTSYVPRGTTFHQVRDSLRREHCV